MMSQGPVHEHALQLLNELAPSARHDEWWGSEGCLEILANALARAALDLAPKPTTER